MPTTVVVNEALAELRKKPDHVSEQVSQEILGTPLEVISTRQKGEWYRVMSPDGYRAWVRGWSVHPMSQSEVQEYRSGSVVEVDALVARVREKASGRSPGIREATLGARLRRIGRTGNWIRVQLPDEARGYIHARDLLLDPKTLRTRQRPHDIHALIRTAHRFLGAPYQWGGITAKGLDCSGYVQTVFRVHGALLPRDSKDQFRYLKRETFIDRNTQDVQYGHLVFFGETDARVGHVGIALTDGRYLHARGRVRINCLRPDAPDFDRDLFRLFRGAGPVLL